MMHPSSLLVVDPDPRGLETLTFGFEREGCTVTGTPDPRRAELLARTARPDLGLVAIREPGQASLEAIAGLHEVAPTLPVVAFGPLAMRAEALRAGATDFLVLPIFLRDLISVARLGATDAAKPEGAAKPDGVAKDEIQMRLSEHYGLFYLLRAMAASGRSGVLQLARGNRRAELRIHEGTLVSVSVGAMQGLPALHHLLLWEESAVSLLQRSVPKRSQLHLSSQEMLDECERFLRDFAHAARELGAPRTIYVPATEQPSEVRGLQPSQLTPLLRLFDGRRGLSDVIEESPFRIFDTVRMIRRLREANVLVVRPEGPRERPPTGPVSTLHAVPNGGPKSMLEHWAMVPDQRGIVGDRRSTSRRLRPLAAMAPAPAPIQLTARKSGAQTSGEIPVAARRPTPAVSNRLAVLPSVQIAPEPEPPISLPPLEAAPPPAEVAVSTEPAPRVRSGTGRQATLEQPSPRVRSGSGRQAPLEDAPRARAGSGRQATLEDPVPITRGRSGSGRHAPLENPANGDAPARPRRTTGQPMTSSAADAFDAIEADFFAREADLYKREAIETFDDLDSQGGGPNGKSPRKKPR